MGMWDKKEISVPIIKLCDKCNSVMILLREVPDNYTGLIRYKYLCPECNSEASFPSYN